MIVYSLIERRGVNSELLDWIFDEGMWLCPYCGGPGEPNFLYCPNCGEAVEGVHDWLST